MKGKSTIAELLLLVDHEALCVGMFENLSEKWVSSCFGTQCTLHFASVEELLLGTLFTVDGHVQEVNTRGFGDDGIDDRPEAESSLLVAELHVRVQQVLQFGEVRIADLTSLIVFVRVVNLRHNRRNQVRIQLRPHRRTPRRFPFRP